MNKLWHMFMEQQLLPISALQHLMFCPRQCALIHIEMLWAENRLTTEGKHLHEKAHDGPAETRRGVRIARGLNLRSLQLGLAGQADVVEFHHNNDDAPPAVRPVEYKRGKPKAHDADRIQLCAQALCLEEMLAVDIPRGDIYYGRTRRRETVDFNHPLRQNTIALAKQLHQLIHSGNTPPAEPAPRCKNCSLIELCLPDLSRRRKVKTYITAAVNALRTEPPHTDLENETAP